MDFVDMILSRVSYRGKFSDVHVPRKDLRRIMEAGLAAPSGCNKQTTSVIAVDDPVVLKKLNDLVDPPVCPTAPAIILVITKQIPANNGRHYNVQDYSAAIQNMLLAITAMGYQSCWYERHITDADNIGGKLAKVLGVPADYQLVCMLPVGVAEEPVRHAAKKPFEERAWFNGFGINEDE